MEKRLAVFDMDGTLIDTLEANYYAYMDVATEMGLGWSLSLEAFKERCFGYNYKTFLVNVLGYTFENAEAIHSQKINKYDKYIKKYGKKIDYVYELAMGLKKSHYLALLTSASKKCTYDVIKNFNLDNLFDLILTADDVTKVKPDLECYRLASERMNVPKERMIIFDDSDSVIDALIKNNYHVFRVY